MHLADEKTSQLVHAKVAESHRTGHAASMCSKHIACIADAQNRQVTMFSCLHFYEVWLLSRIAALPVWLTLEIRVDGGEVHEVHMLGRCVWDQRHGTLRHM